MIHLHLNFGKNQKPNISFFKVWGCLAHVRLPDQQLTKIGYRGVDCVFIGYSQTSKAYRFLNLETPSPHKILNRCMLTFLSIYFLRKKSLWNKIQVLLYLLLKQK